MDLVATANDLPEGSELFFFSPAQGSRPGVVLGSHGSSNSSSLVQDASPPYPPKKVRYYSHALTKEDKQALAQGEQNHNLKPYTPKDVVMHHESRKALVPRGVAVDKLRKMEALANIERDKQVSRRVLDKKVRRSALPVLFRARNEKAKGDRDTHHAQASQSMYDLRSPSTLALAPVKPQPLVTSASPPLPALSRKFSFDIAPPSLSQWAHVRATSSGDYFSRHHVSPSPESLSPSSTGTSNRVRSPLAHQVFQHRHNPNTTFDAFLVPHKSGKGEAFRGAPNAQKVKNLGNADTLFSERSEPSVKERSALRRFSRMPSMPSLKKRAPRRDIVWDGVDSTPDALPRL
jgi:hypothetical protein